MAKAAGYTAVISHRSGETEDATVLIWRSGLGRVRSRPARCAALIGWLSTTGYCGLKQSLASPRRIGGTFSQGLMRWLIGGLQVFFCYCSIDCGLPGAVG